MEKLELKFNTVGKALPPRPIRVDVPGWGGSPDLKRVDGSEPQPWHCTPFVEASTYGLELVYPYENECVVMNDGGVIRFERDWKNEPGGTASDTEFGVFAPLPSQYYFFGTSTDLQAPPGYVLRTDPHPRFYTDNTGTIPAAVPGHVRSEWFPKKTFIVFKVPPIGGRHVFRKGEPFVQILLMPDKVKYEPVRMTEEEAAKRRAMEHSILITTQHIATNVWHNPAGQEFNDHYRVLVTAHARGGQEAVDQIVKSAAERQAQSLPPGLSIDECLQVALDLKNERKFNEARDVYLAILRREPAHAEAMSQLGILASAMNMPQLAVKLLRQAVSVRPEMPNYHMNLGEALRGVGDMAGAEAEYRETLRLSPRDAGALSLLGYAIAQQGRTEEAKAVFHAAMAIEPGNELAKQCLGQLGM
jgi:hypothetical protein